MDDAVQCFEQFKYPGMQGSCFFCNGFYAPNFGEPACVACHAFLFPQDINIDNVNIRLEKTEDEDSGNEEPTQPCDLYCHDPSLCMQSSRVNVRDYKPVSFPNVNRCDKVSEILSLLTTTNQPDSRSQGSIEIDRLPPEVLLSLFSYLDDVSLWSVGQVCKRWQQLLLSKGSQDHIDQEWHMYTSHRWPLYRPAIGVSSWLSVYSKLVESAPCKVCLHYLTNQMTVVPDDDSWRKTRLNNELRSLKSDPPEGIEVTPLDSSLCHWQASITGPIGSPYEGGLFFLYLQIPNTYPMTPPQVRFLTKIFHPNVSRHGDLGLDSIHENWSLALTISKLLISIQSLLTDPYCKVCMEPQIGNLYITHPDKFWIIAQSWTWKFAMHDYILSAS